MVRATELRGRALVDVDAANKAGPNRVRAAALNPGPPVLAHRLLHRISGQMAV